MSLSDTEPRDSRFLQYRNRRIFRSLNGIRALCVLAVIWHHTIPHGMVSLPMADRGFLGVDMFFVISGFLIVTLLLREFDSNGKISLPKFYARRTLRIFPLYYAILGAMSLLYFLFPNASNAAPFFQELPYYATYTSNWVNASVFALFWSLATEEQFYLFWPLIERYLKPIAIPVLLLVLGVNQLINFGFLDQLLENNFGAGVHQLNILQTTFTPICLGVLLAHLLHNERIFQRLGRIFTHPFHVLLSSVLLLIALNWPSNDISGGLRLLIHGTMTYFLATIVVNQDHRLERLLCQPFLKRMGAISYGMYLLHFFGVMGATRISSRLPFGGPATIFLITVLLTVCASEISFRFFESPIMKWKKRFAS